VMELVLLAVGAMVWGLLKWKKRYRQTARARKNRPIHYLSILP
jgi:hypothetical protein